MPRCAAATRDQQYEAEANPNVPTVLMRTSLPACTWQPRRCQSLGPIGIWQCASDTSAVSAKVFSPCLAFSHITRLRSASCILDVLNQLMFFLWGRVVPFRLLLWCGVALLLLFWVVLLLRKVSSTTPMGEGENHHHHPTRGGRAAAPPNRGERG